MKKLLALTLTLVLACSLCVPALADEIVEAPKPKLTLVVNGVASDVPIAANNWTTYADAAALRDILGVKAVAPTYEGPAPVREAAENAGWEVQWYPGDHPGADQQVCLWNKEAFLAEVKPRTQSLQKLFDTAVEMTRTALSTETPKRSLETATVTFTPPNGDKTCKVKLRVETVYQKGVLDCTVTFNAYQLLWLFTDSELEAMAQSGSFSLSDFKTMLYAGKAEFIIDTNVMGFAANIPLLGLIDEDLKGWQTLYIPGMDGALTRAGDVNCAEILYTSMLAAAEVQGGVDARKGKDVIMEAISVFAGPDNVKTTGSNVTWSLKSDEVNAALSKLVGDGDDTISFFRKCDLNLTFNARGEVDLIMGVRPDAQAFTDGVDPDASPDGSDVELTATAHGDLSEFVQNIKLTIKDLGTFDLSAQSTTDSAAQGPRQMAQVEREWVKGDFSGANKPAKP